MNIAASGESPRMFCSGNETYMLSYALKILHRKPSRAGPPDAALSITYNKLQTSECLEATF
jgi:hypothetical protein